MNSAMARIYDLLWLPFSAAPPWVGLLVLGVLFGVVALLAMKYTTNQKRVARFKDRYQGHILAIKLYKDSFTVVTGSLAKTLGWIGAYLCEQFKPMLVMLVPFMLLFAQMQMRLGYRPLAAGTPFLLTAELADSRGRADLLACRVELPAGVAAAVDSAGRPIPPVRAVASRRLVIPLVARADGAHEVRITCGGETITKSIHVGDPDGAPPMVSPLRSNDFVDRLLYPGEPAFGAASAFKSVAVTYPVRPLDCFGLDLSFGSEIGMACVFVLITIVAAFGLKDVFGVTI